MKNHTLFLLILTLFMAGCSKNKDPNSEPSISSQSVSTPQDSEAEDTPASEDVPAPEDEPSNTVVRDLIYEQYDEIDKMGGLPVTATASGKSFQLRAKLFDAKKEACTRTPQTPPGWYTCVLTIRTSLTSNGTEPTEEDSSEQGARIGVKWDKSGKWVRQ